MTIEKDHSVIQEAKDLLHSFPSPPRRHFAVKNSADKDIKQTWSFMSLITFEDNIWFARDPVPVWKRPSTDFLWQRSPFVLDGGGDGSVQSPGVDFLLPYWMGRFYGFISPNE